MKGRGRRCFVQPSGIRFLDIENQEQVKPDCSTPSYTKVEQLNCKRVPLYEWSLLKRWFNTTEEIWEKGKIDAFATPSEDVLFSFI